MRAPYPVPPAFFSVMVMVMSERRDPAAGPATISWSDVYKIGVEVVDAEHERLFAAYQDVIDRVEAGSGPSAIRDALAVLENYIVEHFTNEEELMISIDFPDLFAHKIAHLDFQVSVMRFRKAITDGEDISEDLLGFFGSWLVSHITVMDRRIGEFLRASSP